MTDYKKLYSDLLTNERVGRRERLAMEMLHNQGFCETSILDNIERWIEGKSPAPIKLGAKKRGRKAKAKKAVAKTLKTGKRRYTKKSKYWKKLGK
jgi:hypothetical protein